jgi:hypothetical protein
MGTTRTRRSPAPSNQRFIAELPTTRPAIYKETGNCPNW